MEIIHAANSDRVAYWRRQGALVRQDIGAGISIFDSYLAILNQMQNKQLLAFFLFLGTSPKDCAFLGGKENTLKLKTTAKLNRTQTSIATVRDLYRMYATLERKSHLCIPFLGIARPQPQFSQSCVCERFI